MDLSKDFHTAQDLISSALVETTRSATSIAAEDIGFHRSLNPANGAAIDHYNARLLSLSEKLLRASASTLDVEKPSLPDADAVDGNWRSIVDVVDGLLERVDTCLDEFTGLLKRLSPSQQSQMPSPKPKSRKLAQSYRTQNIPKPQLLFENVPTNDATTPFKPLLSYKPHAIVPLKQDLKKSQKRKDNPQYPHPYQTEIEQYKYPSSVYQRSDPIAYLPFDGTDAAFVDTLEKLDAMIEELKKAKEIAIDVEHHDSHSYIGLVSLMQISTRDKDWVIDTLKPWRQKLERLNEVFADPNILKVFHGAHMDMIWLQRDLGLYVVGLFDTHHASRVLGYPGGSLAYLLKRFIDFDAQKQYQMADWRLRPLPSELFDYARSDTHFLLNIYDHMRNELMDKSNFVKPGEDRLKTVLEKSKETALQRYEHPVYDEKQGLGPTGWLNLLRKAPVLLSKEQLAVFRAVHQWRDSVARQEDEGVFTVMPNHAIFNIAKAMPDTIPAVLSCAQPLTKFVRIRSSELLGVISVAKAEGENGPELAAILADTYKALGITTPTVDQHPSSELEADSFIHRDVSLDSHSLRAPSSSFWGNITDRSEGHRTHNTMPTLDQLQLALLMPPFTVEGESLLGTGNGRSPSLQTDKNSEALSRTSFDDSMEVEETTQMDPQGQKGKFDGKTEAYEPISPTSTSETTELEIKAVEKVRKTSAKRAAKKARKENGAQNGTPTDRHDVSHEDEHSKPFDYASAPSVLHAPRILDELGGGAEKPFNPYAKAMDAPAGLPRAQNFRTGKSKTFGR